MSEAYVGIILATKTYSKCVLANEKKTKKTKKQFTQNKIKVGIKRPGFISHPIHLAQTRLPFECLGLEASLPYWFTLAELPIPSLCLTSSEAAFPQARCDPLVSPLEAAPDYGVMDGAADAEKQLGTVPPCLTNSN